MTRSLLDGKSSGWNKTVAFEIEVPTEEPAQAIVAFGDSIMALSQ